MKERIADFLIEGFDFFPKGGVMPFQTQLRRKKRRQMMVVALRSARTSPDSEWIPNLPIKFCGKCASLPSFEPGRSDHIRLEAQNGSLHDQTEQSSRRAMPVKKRGRNGLDSSRSKSLSKRILGESAAEDKELFPKILKRNV